MAPLFNDQKQFPNYFSQNYLSIVEVSMSSNFATRSVMDKKFTFESKLSTLGNFLSNLWPC